jgi:hypothetical protein
MYKTREPRAMLSTLSRDRPLQQGDRTANSPMRILGKLVGCLLLVRLNRNECKVRLCNRLVCRRWTVKTLNKYSFAYRNVSDYRPVKQCATFVLLYEFSSLCMVITNLIITKNGCQWSAYRVISMPRFMLTHAD